MPVRRVLVLLLSIALLLPGPPAFAAKGHEQVVDLTFPVAGRSSYGDSFSAARSGGRVHKATDIMAPEGAPIHAAVGGVVEWITGLTEKVPSYGYMIRIAGDDGRDYAYIHMGRNQGPATKAYAPGIVKGSRVARGQLIAYVGCSGNASCTAPHLHFEIHDDRVTDPYKTHQINPYPSLRAAQRRGDLPGAIVHPFSDIARSVHLPAIVAMSDAGIVDGCGGGRFCPNDAIDRAEMARVLRRALRLPKADRDFFDDDEGLPAEPAINALAAAGVVKGCGDGTGYCPDGSVTRARMATYLARGFSLQPASRNFFDDDDGHGHEDSINRLASSGITVGCSPTRFCVTGKVTRGQVASFLVRALDG
ncbi:MAG TPA: S-layer homology domain-containing protein [Euzebyales bacterium]|nr:S-layer homology domain-containing protein [Euzebyales bacterium]